MIGINTSPCTSDIIRDRIVKHITELDSFGYMPDDFNILKDLIDEYELYKRIEDINRNIPVACDLIDKYAGTDTFIYHRKVLYKIIDEYFISKPYYIIKKIKLKGFDPIYLQLNSISSCIIDELNRASEIRTDKYTFANHIIYSRKSRQSITIIKDINNPKRSMEDVNLPVYKSMIKSIQSIDGYSIETKDGNKLIVSRERGLIDSENNHLE